MTHSALFLNLLPSFLLLLASGLHLQLAPLPVGFPVSFLATLATIPCPPAG